MKAPIINFLLTIIFSLVIIFLSFKKSGGDVFVLIMIIGFTILQMIMTLIIRMFVNFDYLKVIKWILFGFCVSIAFYFIANRLATK